MNESENDSIEYLINTRKRRANAGNRLQKLLEQEIKDTQLRRGNFDTGETFVNDDDDEVDLLFQEDEDDKEFQIESDGFSDNDSNTSLNKKNRDDTSKNILSDIDDDNLDSQRIKVSPYLNRNDEDMMLSSDSDIDVSNESDAEAGEKELQREEKLKKRKKKKVLPTIIRKKAKRDDSIDSDIPKKERIRTSTLGSLQQVKAESLLTATRRTSNRSSTIANKIKIYEKLAKAEEKHKRIQLKLKKKRDENKLKLHKLTQEDRLRIAEETEKLNLQSLNRFKEQEIFKKQTRLALQERQKLKFDNDEPVIRYLSTTWQISPLSELEDYKYWNEQLQKRETTKKKKYGRKSKKQLEKENNQRNPQPLLSKEEEEKNGVELNRLPIKQENKIISEGASTNARSQAISTSITEQETSDSKLCDDMVFTTKTQTIDNDLRPLVNKEIKDSISTNPNNLLIGNNNDSNNQNDSSNNLSTKKEAALTETSQTKTSGLNGSSLVLKSSSETISPINHELSKNISTDFIGRDESKQGKKKENLEEAEASKEERQDEIKKEEKIQYEGPYQQVSKNFITVYKFSTQTYNHVSEDIPNYDFLPKSSIQVSKGKNQTESDSMETILRSKLKIRNNGQEITNDAIKVSATSIDNNGLPSLTFLDEFPEFGEFDKKIVNQVVAMDIKANSIKITKEAPMGIYINSIKKHCFINNNDCQYFDPKLGIPYSNLSSYRVIQDIQNPDGNYKWFGFENGGIYLNVNQKPAKGVPEGF